MIREYFLNYNECLSNDFVMSNGGMTIELLSSDIKDWRITFVDTGLHSNIGERLVAVRRYVEDEPLFLANYSDGLSDIPLDSLIDTLHANDSIACFAGVRTQQSFHAVRSDDNNIVKSMGAMNDSGQWINGGFFVLRNSIFDYINPGDELVEEPFQRLIKEQKLSAIRYDGYWQSMDTLKDKITIDRMYARGDAPWELWKK
jgi:glucose-1-phosphate cytidylyltransferase